MIEMVVQLSSLSFVSTVVLSVTELTAYPRRKLSNHMAGE
jgi:hypothetical protein